MEEESAGSDINYIITHNAAFRKRMYLTSQTESRYEYLVLTYNVILLLWHFIGQKSNPIGKF